MKIDPQRLKSARTARGITQRQVATVAGVSVQAVSQWETGKSEPEFSRLNIIANVLGVDYEWLLGQTDKPGSNTVSRYIEDKTVPVILIDNVIMFQNFGFKTNTVLQIKDYVSPTIPIIGQGFAVIAEQLKMSPMINEGDLLIFDTGFQPEAGDVVAAFTLPDYTDPVVRLLVETPADPDSKRPHWGETHLRSVEADVPDLVLGLGEGREIGFVVAGLVEQRRYRKGVVPIIK